jgi:hypothetical protein
MKSEKCPFGKVYAFLPAYEQIYLALFPDRAASRRNDRDFPRNTVDNTRTEHDEFLKYKQWHTQVREAGAALIARHAAIV